MTTSLTLEVVEAAIARAALNGDKWKMGDVESQANLEQLIRLREQLIAAQASSTLKLYGVSFQNPGGSSRECR